MINTDNLAAAIEAKYGACCDTAVSKDKDGKKSFTITRWNKSIAGIDKPNEATIAQAISEYEAAEAAKKQDAKDAFARLNPDLQTVLKYMCGEIK